MTDSAHFDWGSYEAKLDSMPEPLRTQMKTGDFEWQRVSLTKAQGGLLLDIESGDVTELRKPEHAHLFKQHACELEPGMAGRLEPNWDLYSAAQVSGQLAVIAAWGREEDSGPRRLVGYAIAAVCESMHYRDHVFCQLDGLFVVPEWRGRGTAVRLIWALREQARRFGAEQLIMHAKLDSRMERLLTIIGLVREEVVFKEDL